MLEAKNRYVENERHLRLIPFDDGRAIWENLLTKCPAAALYHRQSWTELLRRAYRFPLLLATLEEKGSVVAASVIARAKNPLVRRFVSLPFSDYCPPLAIDKTAATQLLEALVGETFPGASWEVRGMKGPPGWHTVGCFVVWTLRLDRSLASVERTLGNNFRRNLRRAARDNIAITRGTGNDHLRRFYSMQLLARRKLGLPAQPWKFFKLMGEIFSASGNLDVWVAKRGEEDVASVVLLRDEQTLYYKWGARQPGDRSSANCLLLWNVIEEYSSRVRVIDLGRTDKSNGGLMRFKKELGANAAALPYCFYPQAPGQVSPEALTGARRMVAGIWRHLPIFAVRFMGRVAYRYLA